MTCATKHIPEGTKLRYIEKNSPGGCSRTPLATSRSGMYFNTSYFLKLYHPCLNIDLGL